MRLLRNICLWVMAGCLAGLLVGAAFASGWYATEHGAWAMFAIPSLLFALAAVGVFIATLLEPLPEL